MTGYTTARRDGAWWVVDADGSPVDVYGAGSAGATAATAAAEVLNATASRSGPASSLRAWRLAHGLSQARLADLLGVRWLTVQRWEAGHSGLPRYLHLALERLEQRLTEVQKVERSNSC